MNTFVQWVKGLVSVAISSAAGGVAIVVVDPMTFNFSTGLAKLGEVCGVLALIHTALYLQKSPLPGINTETGAPPPSNQNQN